MLADRNIYKQSRLSQYFASIGYQSGVRPAPVGVLVVLEVLKAVAKSI